MSYRPNPNRQLDAFQTEVRAALTQYKDVDKALENAGVPDGMRNQTAADAAFRLGVHWEIFQGRWHIAAISKEPRAFQRARQSELNNIYNQISPADKDLLRRFSGIEAPRVSANIKREDIEAFLDPRGFNITFKDSAAWREDAIKQLDSPYKDAVIKLCADSESTSFLNFLTALRNALAHRSKKSMAALNTAARERVGSSEGLVGPKNKCFIRDVNNVSNIGKYIISRAFDDSLAYHNRPRRVESLHSRIIEVSEGLRV